MFGFANNALSFSVKYKGSGQKKVLNPNLLLEKGGREIGQIVSIHFCIFFFLLFHTAFWRSVELLIQHTTSTLFDAMLHV